LSEPVPSAWPAPAKLNLFLHVIGRRPDGYHEIQTLFQLVDFFDELSIEVTDSNTVTRLDCDYGVAEAHDLVVRSARLLQAATGTRRGARIQVRKQIPLGAGLGGGSSNAATTLLVLNELWQCGLSLDELAALALSLGADVPVFVQGHTAFASGIGEKLHFLDLGKRHYLLVFNPLHISTAEIFRHPDLVRNAPPVNLASALADHGRNDCEAVVCKLYPQFAQFLDDLRPWGNPRMTGTGSCVFLAMPDENAAKTAAREIECRYNVRAVSGLDRSPLHGMLGLAQAQ
jgi:4-diphosphocytidyl-2-C-methyl-D-erythritol kinase